MRKKTSEYVMKDSTLESLEKIIGAIESEEVLINKVKELAKRNLELKSEISGAKVIHAGGKAIRLDNNGQVVVPVTVEIPQEHIKALEFKAKANNITLEKCASIIFAEGLEYGWCE